MRTCPGHSAWRRRAWRLLAALGLATSAPGAAAQPRTTPQLLVDLARDEGLSVRGQQTPAHVARMRALLRAALQLDPHQTDAYVWLYELALLSGDSGAASDVLEELVARHPQHEGVFHQWLQLGPRGIQTLEQRAAWLTRMLSAQRPDPLQAAIHLQLAALASQRLDRSAAREHLEQAWRLHPDDPRAARLAVMLVDPQSPPAERLRVALRALRLNPLHGDLSFGVGAILDEMGAAARAAVFYDHALAVEPQPEASSWLTTDHWLQMARSACAAQRWDRAESLVRRVIAVDPHRVPEAAMLLYWILDARGQARDARQVRSALAARYAEIREPAGQPVDELAQAAWFYVTIDVQPERALLLAEAAAQMAPQDPFVQRVMGWAQAANLRVDEAERTLAPLVDDDAYAACRLAELRMERQDVEGARQVLARLKPAAACSWPASRRIAELHLPAATQPAGAAAPIDAELLHELERVEGTLALFRGRPGDVVSAEIALESVRLQPGDPWWAVFSITNRSEIPLALGPDGVLEPVFLLSLSIEGDGQREFPDLMTVSIDDATLIPPGKTVRVRRTLDVGPPRRLARQCPQRLQRVVVRALVDPRQLPDGRWGPGPCGLQLRPVYFNRLPASVGPEAFGALFSALSGEAPGPRFRAVEVLAELLGEAQRAQAGRLAYRPEPVPVARIQAALRNALSGDDWEMRVRTLEALQVAGLDAPLYEAAKACLEHAHWAVRLMAVRLLSRQGRTFLPVAQRLAADDPHELVRATARSYVDEWSAATTQPAQEASRTPAAAPAATRPGAGAP